MWRLNQTVGVYLIKMTYWFIAHTAWFVYTAKAHFVWVILPPKHIRSGLAELLLLLIRMTKNPSLHYNHKPSRSFQQTNLNPHMLNIQSTCRSSPTLNQFTSTAGKTPYQLQNPSAAGHAGKLRDHLSDKLRLNRHLRMQPHISKTYFCPIKAQRVKE